MTLYGQTAVILGAKVFPMALIVCTLPLVQEELPEGLVGTIRLEHLDLSKAAALDTETGTISRKD